MAFSIRLTENEKRLAESYAKLHSMSVGEAIKKAFFEKVEDEFDVVIANDAYAEYASNPKTYSHEETRKLLGL